MPLSFSSMEVFYEALAEGLDAIPVEKRELFLTKLALLLAREMPNSERRHCGRRRQLRPLRGLLKRPRFSQVNFTAGAITPIIFRVIEGSIRPLD